MGIDSVGTSVRDDRSTDLVAVNTTRADRLVDPRGIAHDEQGPTDVEQPRAEGHVRASSLRSAAGPCSLDGV